MLALEILFHVLELAATFAVGAWTGSNHCRFVVAVSTDEERRESWLDHVCCVPQRLKRGTSGDSKHSDPPESPKK